MRIKVLITTAGVGDKLGEMGSTTNGSLIRLGTKPVISHIVELYPADAQFIVLTGFLAEQMEDFLMLTYPNRKFTFVRVDKFHGKGSSLAYSLLQAKNLLQCPFIFHAGDTVVLSTPPEPTYNWVGGAKGHGSSQYASMTTVGGYLGRIYEKGYANPDYLHVGMIGIKDYQTYWQCLERVYAKDPESISTADFHGVNGMLDKNIKFKIHIFENWYDTGNLESLIEARHAFPDEHNVLDKEGESIFIYNDFIIKYFADSNIVSQRVARAKILGNLVPKILGHKQNFYKYQFVKGRLYSDVANPNNFAEFLEWCKKFLWSKRTEVTAEEFNKICHNFYYNKSLRRISRFLKEHSVQDSSNIINGEEVPPIKKIIEMIDFNWLCNTKQCNFHGDFILDNIIKTQSGYRLLDWRQNFGGLLRAGDMYYDLAKLNHNLTINHAIVNKNLFHIDVKGFRIECDIMRRDNLVECQRQLFEFICSHDMDLSKVKLLTGLVWLNMSPLHHHPFDMFLFYYGKLHLWRALNEK